MEDYNILKIIFIIVALLEAFLMGIIPVKCKYFKESPRVLGIANAFSGGVFIAICLMHIMPEQTENYNDLYKDSKFPLPFLFLMVGYVLILVLDKVMFDAHSVFHQEDEHHHSFIGYQTAKASLILRQSMNELMQHPNDINTKKSISDSQIMLENAIKKEVMQGLKRTEKFAAKISMSQHRASQVIMEMNNEEDQNITQEVLQKRKVDSNQYFVDGQNVDFHSAKAQKRAIQIQPQEMKKQSTCFENMTPFILMMGLGAHAVFEGIAVGISQDMSQVQLLCLAIIMHKGAAGMSLGISMAKVFPNRNNFIFSLLFMFSLFTPIGVIIGMILQNSSNPMIEIVFNCLAGGTFLYIACSEVIIEEFSQPENKFLKLLFFVVGIAVISSLLFLE